MAEQREEAGVSCTICLDLFAKPKLLPCCHTFCKECLEGILENSPEGVKKITCPQCRVEHQVPSNGTKGFVDDYTLPTNQLKKELKSNPTLEVCDQCDEQVTAVSYCSVCASYLCDSCTKAHKKNKFLKSHEIESLSPDKQHLSKQPLESIRCIKHPEEYLKLYCKSCQCLNCLICFVASHNGHDVGDIDSETRKVVEKQIEMLATQAESKLIEYEGNLEYITKVEKKTAPELVPIKAEINTLFDSLVATLQTRRAALLEEAEATHNRDMKELWAQKDHVENTLAGLRGALNLAKRALKCSHDLELLAVGSQSMGRLKELGELHWNSLSTETRDLTRWNFIYDKPTNLDTLGQLQSKTNSSLILPDSARVGSVVSLKLPIRFKSEARRHSERPRVTVLDRKLRAMTRYSPTVVPSPDGQMWDISFTPVVGSDHVLKIESKTQSGEHIVIDAVVCVDDTRALCYNDIRVLKPVRNPCRVGKFHDDY